MLALRTWRSVGAVFSALCVLFVCAVGVAGSGTSEATGTGDHGLVELKVMTFNIWLGGTQVDLDQVPVAIQAADADIVGIQEPRENLRAIAEYLGYHYHDGLNLLSRYPIVLPPDRSPHYVLIELEPGRVVAGSNVHLRAFPYGPYELRDGQSLDRVLVYERFHVAEMRGKIETLVALAEQGVPVFVTGDFNVPSHLDWTAEAAAASPEPFRQEVAWPVSVLLEEQGFRDTFREQWPDPVATPGYTWSPGYPVPHLDENEIHDRIDFVYAIGPSQTLSSLVVGEPGPHTDIVVTPWPTDHRAVVSHFALTPVPIDSLHFGEPPTLQGPDVVSADDSVTFTYTGGTGHPEAWIGIYPKGMKPGLSNSALRWSYIVGSEGEYVFDRYEGRGPVWPLAPGDYQAHLFADGEYYSIATWDFHVE